MEWTDRIVTRTPLTQLWTATGPLKAVRAGPIGAERIRSLLAGAAVQFVVADAGLPLRWISASERFRFWKAEAAAWLVEPSAERFHLSVYPGGYCFTAEEWILEDGAAVVLLVRHH